LTANFGKIFDDNFEEFFEASEELLRKKNKREQEEQKGTRRKRSLHRQLSRKGGWLLRCDLTLAGRNAPEIDPVNVFGVEFRLLWVPKFGAEFRSDLVVSWSQNGVSGKGLEGAEGLAPSENSRSLRSFESGTTSPVPGVGPNEACAAIPGGNPCCCGLAVSER
jgi:hypothetical protein